jgi:diaminopimelate epimerase
MRIFNADGSEAEMCGNGARCAALWFKSGKKSKTQNVMIETKAGLIDSGIRGEIVKIGLTEPKDTKLGMPLELAGRRIKADFINTGVPHAVVFVSGLAAIDVKDIGNKIRNHGFFSPRGTNVDFVEVLGKHSIAVRTYERGVEDETLACGTGSTASALIFALKTAATGKVSVHTRSKEVLNVYFDRSGEGFRDVWLEGKAKIIYKGVYHV